MNTYAVILAAGQGTRMKSKLYKVLHPVCGMPMVEHVTTNVSQLGVEKIVTIVGHGAEKVQEQLGSRSEYALQEEQLGTAHAVQQAASLIEGKSGTTLVVCGDTPLIRPETMQALLDHHAATKAKATILTAIADNPTGYGRILRSEAGSVEKIVEQKDASPEEQLVKEINTGTYCFDNEALFEALKLVSNDNVQGEYYLPDVIEILQKQGEIVAAFATDSFEETLGVNDRVALSEAERILRARIAEKHMRAGVTLIDPATTYISAQAEIGADTIIQPNVVIEGNTKIGEDCFISSGTTISNSIIGDRTTVRSSHVYDSTVGEDVAVGPFAHLRPQSNLGNDVKIGNFVEVKKSSLGNGSKVSHLSYIGDAEVGTNVNIGCGTITVNYDGKNKYLTKIEDDSFIGCNSNLIAPVTIGKGSYVAAGSTISKNVPSDSLAIARARQENKEGYATKLNGKK
ncbi:bifunctional UDP-N-acetylglucosamine diphosphorylase/glucosamine-1-phosphate N-acetyltransferase GlmU [Planococcus sp. N028]|uniref:Bifunctional protein GlmU n=1 Tax=Planococcus shixiaomingii TaxID=3058393 RepID=A0ABT8N7U1_9BACL|nr:MULTISPECIES: bifunctional UDP-N-acetylglucosamine diphosphorylase/glucosamine-1-phosphate N-acetyltransferase GlmU [unclassified Planococcus (in: firmicutes)]MDN7243814.1 bifunctional UDP-N-acetylglucosamine diphosphorylase/glucosamine-1-phosphate N-acetyltransferase GlmU [Planococcus sp. N028]WKA54869.1 bifunctional UDP-N-acetylglucosamine diphosphorylase/glucosamine-1-phosphate N-acetyltransferase GlmU [Planococcus sp. N022]